MKKTVIHAVAGSLAMLLIATFLISTLVSELFLEKTSITTVKHYIAVYGLVCLVVLMAVTGGSGFTLARGRKGRLIADKAKRMRRLGANGVLIMIPAALFLNMKAAAGSFDTGFYLIQTVEWVAGLIQLILMARNFHAGLRLSGRMH